MAPHDSHPEVELADALRARGVPVEAQVPVHRPNGRKASIDLAVPDVRWGVEVDIHPEHQTVDGAARDAQRRRDLHLAGWQIEVVAELDMRQVGRVVDELAALYVRRRRELTPSIAGS